MRSKTLKALLPSVASLWLGWSDPAQAGLVAYTLDYAATAQVVQVDATGTRNTLDQQQESVRCYGFFCQSTRAPTLVQVLASATPNASQQAHAAQDGYGAFGQRQNVSLANYDSGVQQVHSHTATEYSYTVGADAPGSLLQVDFRWLGSRVAAGSYYGSGAIDASSSVQILVARNGGAEQLIWGFDDAVHLAPGVGNGLFTTQSTEVDLLNAGLPTRGFETEWRDFMVWGDLERGTYFGTLDLGVLQPGESFTLIYRARSDLTMSDVRYASRGELLLDDPFNLREPAIQLRGVAFEIVDGSGPPALPEPGSLALLLGGLAGLGAVGRARQAACARPVGASSQASTSRGSVNVLRLV